MIWKYFSLIEPFQLCTPPKFQIDTLLPQILLIGHSMWDTLYMYDFNMSALPIVYVVSSLLYVILYKYEVTFYTVHTLFVIEFSK